MDLDNTLIDRRGPLANWVVEFAAARQLSAAAADRISVALRERASAETFEDLRSAFGLAESAAELWGAYVTGMARGVVCSPEVLARIDLLRSTGWTVGVLTNGATDIQLAKLAATGLLDRLDAVCISDEAGARKPDVEAFRVAVARCGYELPAGAWMVGDNPATDIAGAAAAGLRTVWISAGSAWATPGLTPDHIAETAAEAADFLLGLSEGMR
ncbi:HAD family hydrolase [Kitasatospora sp. GAS1066B]|uniref:HAD family hydrolase n=1 Tax=Kitasatospora sp. GAS1066B TaxID=3156271 RepID=UPI003512125B